MVKLPNIGKKLAQRLEEADITSLENLKEIRR